jgi:hypothetical protein
MGRQISRPTRGAEEKAMHQRAGCSDAIAFLLLAGISGAEFFSQRTTKLHEIGNPPRLAEPLCHLPRAIARCQHSQLVKKLVVWWAGCEAWGDAVACLLAAKVRDTELNGGRTRRCDWARKMASTKAEGRLDWHQAAAGLAREPLADSPALQPHFVDHHSAT